MKRESEWHRRLEWARREASKIEDAETVKRIAESIRKAEEAVRRATKRIEEEGISQSWPEVADAEAKISDVIMEVAKERLKGEATEP